MARDPDPTPRIPPVPQGQWDQAAIAAARRLSPPPDSVYLARREARGGAGGVNALALLVRNPALAEAFLGFNGYLLYENGIDDRLRELVILRVAWRLDSAYEWGQHVPVALESGATTDELDRLRADIDLADWGALEGAALRATDELLDDADVSDATFAALAEHLDEPTLLDFLFTVGTYAMLAMVFNTARVPFDEGLEGFPDG